MASPEQVTAAKAFLAARAKFKKAEKEWMSAKADASRFLSIDQQNSLLTAVLRKEEAKAQAERDARNKARLASLALHEARLANHKAREDYRKAKAAGTLPPATAPKDIPDIGGEDLNGNAL